MLVGCQATSPQCFGGLLLNKNAQPQTRNKKTSFALQNCANAQFGLFLHAMRRYLYLVAILGAIMALHACNGCGGKQPNANTATNPTAQKADSTKTVQTPQTDSITKLIDKKPDESPLYFARCNEFIKTGSYDAALKDIAKAIQLEPKNPQYYLTESDIYFLQRDLPRSINALEQGNTAVPDNAEILLNLGKYYYYHNDNQKALGTLNKLLNIDNQQPDAFFYLAQIFKEGGDTAKAAKNYLNVIELDPQYYDAYMQLALIKSAKKDKMALDYFKNALKIDSTSMEAKYGMAMFYQNNKNYPKAIEIYRQMVIDSPQYEKPYYNLGYIYFQMDSLKKADRNFEIATSVKPEYADAYFMRGLIAEATGDLKTAQYFYDQTLKLDPKNNGAIEGFGRLRNLKKQ